MVCRVCAWAVPYQGSAMRSHHERRRRCPRTSDHTCYQVQRPIQPMNGKKSSKPGKRCFPTAGCIGSEILGNIATTGSPVRRENSRVTRSVGSTHSAARTSPMPRRMLAATPESTYANRDLSETIGSAGGSMILIRSGAVSIRS
jgi:hypothetical protein